MRSYSYTEIKEFEANTEGHKSIQYLLENVNAMRMLGWRLTLGRKIAHDKINGYTDVIKYSPSIGNKFILTKDKEPKEVKKRKMIKIIRKKGE